MIVDSSYFVRVEYLNGTHANETDPYLLNGCPDIDCPFSNFTAIYKPRFPAGADVECRKKYPPAPPLSKSKFKFNKTKISLSCSFRY